MRSKTTTAGNRLLERRVMFHRRSPQKKWKAQPLSGLGLKLVEEEHDQERDEMQHLLITQRQLDCQLEHGRSPVCAGSAANWLELAVYYTPLRGVALGLPRMALSVSYGLRGSLRVARGLVSLTFSGLSDRILDAITPRNRYPARGSARVITLTHNVELTGGALAPSSDRRERG